MFLKYLQSNRQFMRSYKKIMNENAFATNPKSINYSSFESKAFPYVLGGVKVLEKINPIDGFIKTTINENIFKELYTNLLTAIQLKELTKIQQLVEPQLLLPLMNPSAPLKLINKGSAINLKITRLQYGMGVQFMRNHSSQYKTISDQPQFHAYLELTPEQKESCMNQKQMPILITQQIVFTSRLKLISSGKEENTTLEQHKIWFEQENYMSFQDIDHFFRVPIDQNKSVQFKKLLFSSSNPWRIGNIDNFLPHRVQL